MEIRVKAYEVVEPASARGPGQAVSGSVHVVLARAPRAGHVKTRLARDTSPSFAAAFQEACVRDWIERPPFSGARLLLVDADSTLWDEARARGWAVETQTEGDLGRRLQQAVDQGSHHGSTIVITGTDSPDLSPALLEAAIAALEGADAAFVAALDGGYVLVACRADATGFFDEIPWSTERTLEASLARVRALGLRAVCVGRWWDVDTVADLDHVVFNASQRGTQPAPWRPRHTLELLARAERDLSST
jgi:rSAM/selenodomain-associated transferase 1